MMYGIEELTKDGQGYILWKGHEVEHYSFRSEENERPAAEKLAGRCRHLEALGVPVNISTAVWSWSWFEGFTPESFAALPQVVREIITEHHGVLYERGGEFCWLGKLQELPKEYPFTYNRSLCVYGNPIASVITSDDLGGFYHPLKRLGWDIAQMGQGKDLGCCYATTEQVLAWFKAKGVEL